MSTLSNDDMDKVNINKLKEYWHNDTWVVVMANVVTIQKKSKSKWDSHHNAKPKWLPSTNSTPNQDQTNLTQCYGPITIVLKNWMDAN